ncbi:MAG TPA: Uma2 family endonuclease [Thermoanaerobaculia bacterium]|nr:Uma2 family endonuclease [Thermoanaerobaculia bacterium]
MAKPAYKVKFTYEDYQLFPDDGRRHELIGGEHCVAPAPRRPHQRAVGNLQIDLGGFVREHRLGFVYPAPFDVVLSDEDVVQPDLVFVSNERASIAEDAGIFGAPDLVVEVLSDSTRKTDERIKRKLYEVFGVREYWLADPVLETVKVYRLSAEGSFQLVAELSAEEEDRLETPLLPGLSIPLNQIFQ